VLADGQALAEAQPVASEELAVRPGRRGEEVGGGGGRLGADLPVAKRTGLGAHGGDDGVGKRRDLLARRAQNRGHGQARDPDVGSRDREGDGDLARPDAGTQRHGARARRVAERDGLGHRAVGHVIEEEGVARHRLARRVGLAARKTPQQGALRRIHERAGTQRQLARLGAQQHGGDPPVRRPRGDRLGVEEHVEARGGRLAIEDDLSDGRIEQPVAAGARLRHRLLEPLRRRAGRPAELRVEGPRQLPAEHGAALDEQDPGARAGQGTRRGEAAQAAPMTATS